MKLVRIAVTHVATSLFSNQLPASLMLSEFCFLLRSSVTLISHWNVLCCHLATFSLTYSMIKFSTHFQVNSVCHLFTLRSYTISCRPYSIIKVHLFSTDTLKEADQVPFDAPEQMPNYLAMLHHLSWLLFLFCSPLHSFTFITLLYHSITFYRDLLCLP